MPRKAVPYGWLHHGNLFHVIRKRLSVLFLLIGMFKGQHFSMDGRQGGGGIFFKVKNGVQLNFPTTATLRTEASSRFRDVLNKSQCMDWPPKKCLLYRGDC